jgi:hypothetical protein
VSFIERSGESLARRIDRRRFLRQSAAGAFGLAAAWAVEGMHGRSAVAQVCEVVTGPDECHCRYQFAPSCGDRQGCTLDTSFYTRTGCWCTITCWYGGNRCGHHVCCDHVCPGLDGQCIVDKFVRDACPKKKHSIPRG